MMEYFDEDGCALETFITQVERETTLADVPLASQISKNVPIYDVAEFKQKLNVAGAKRTLMAEWAKVLLSGPGVLALKGAYENHAVLDEATAIYEQIIAQEKQQSGGAGDHFAAAGANDRIWNSLQKLCEASPDVYVRYFANVPIAAVCEAWLGPGYQMTAQVNVVHPGGQAQQAHRDYHLGFMTAAESAQFPAHVHDLSPVLTLQGAVAHCDMSLESGPTKLLPFSQTYRPGYVAWRRDDFRAYFEENCVQIPLAKGDALFFNPALFHAAGCNTSADIHRMANLLQVSSPLGRAMETLDRVKMCKLIYPVVQGSELTAAELSAAIAATAEEYSFPTNLDKDPPKGGLAPATQATIFAQAIQEGMSAKAFCECLDDLAARQLA